MLYKSQDKLKIYYDFFEEINIFKEKQTKQKQRGINDFNIITTVLNYHDEVRVHSRMIASFLDINGKHYQDDLFLDKFLNIIGIQNYNSNNSKIYLEYENIDLYLTDGIRHIIIENKIWAEDQKAQINRYINIIKKQNQDLNYQNLYVIYLSIDRNKPSKESLNSLIIKNNYILQDDIKIAQYININYKDKILEWLKICQFEVQNITNLNEAFKQYIDIVKMVTNQYEGKVMDFKDILKKDRKKFKIAKEISEAYKQAEKELKIESQNIFWKYLETKLNENNLNFTYVNSNYEQINIADKVENYWNQRNRTYHFGLKHDIKHINEKYNLSFFIEVDWRIYYGFTIHTKNQRGEYSQLEEVSEISNTIINSLENYKWKSTFKNNSWWICWKYSPDEFNFKEFSGKGIENLLDSNFTSIDNMVKEIIELIKYSNTLS